MTDSDSLRGDPNYDPTRRHHPELRELDMLRALLRPRMTATGDPTSTDALRGLLVEIERLTDQVLPDLLGLMKRHVRFADERVQAHLEHAKGRVAEAEAALALLGWDRTQDMMIWARSSAQPVAAARWTKICEAFGFDPEEDPPASIPAILAGDRWTNTRRMLADACANLRAPSLEVILGELVQTLSKARALVHTTRRDSTCTACARRIHEGKATVQGCGDCYWLEFGDAPPQAQDAAPTAQGRARCPVCHRTAHAAEQTASLQEKLTAQNKELEGVRAALEKTTVWARTTRTALRVLGWDGTGDPDAWASAKAADFDTFSSTVRTALDIPPGKPLLPYIRHVATGMKALAILGWQDGHPVEWATARAAAEADLRGAFAEAELVGSDHATMVRQLWGNLQRMSNLYKSAGDERKRVATWRAWVIGMCPEGAGVTVTTSDDDLRAAMTFVPAHALEAVTSKFHDASAKLRNAYIKLDTQDHAITNLNHELRMAGERYFNGEAARRGEVDAFGEALSKLYPLWPGWSPRDICSPIAIFHDVITEIQKRLAPTNLSP